MRSTTPLGHIVSLSQSELDAIFGKSNLPNDEDRETLQTYIQKKTKDVSVVLTTKAFRQIPPGQSNTPSLPRILSLHTDKNNFSKTLPDIYRALGEGGFCLVTESSERENQTLNLALLNCINSLGSDLGVADKKAIQTEINKLAALCKFIEDNGGLDNVFITNPETQQLELNKIYETALANPVFRKKGKLAEAGFIKKDSLITVFFNAAKSKKIAEELIKAKAEEEESKRAEIAAESLKQFEIVKSQISQLKEIAQALKQKENLAQILAIENSEDDGRKKADQDENQEYLKITRQFELAKNEIKEQEQRKQVVAEQHQELLENLEQLLRSEIEAKEERFNQGFKSTAERLKTANEESLKRESIFAALAQELKELTEKPVNIKTPGELIAINSRLAFLKTITKDAELTEKADQEIEKAIKNTTREITYQFSIEDALLKIENFNKAASTPGQKKVIEEAVQHLNQEKERVAQKQFELQNTLKEIKKVLSLFSDEDMIQKSLDDFNENFDTLKDRAQKLIFDIAELDRKNPDIIQEEELKKLTAQKNQVVFDAENKINHFKKSIESTLETLKESVNKLHKIFTGEAQPITADEARITINQITEKLDAITKGLSGFEFSIETAEILKKQKKLNASLLVIHQDALSELQKLSKPSASTLKPRELIEINERLAVLEGFVEKENEFLDAAYTKLNFALQDYIETIETDPALLDEFIDIPFPKNLKDIIDDAREALVENSRSAQKTPPADNLTTTSGVSYSSTPNSSELPAATRGASDSDNAKSELLIPLAAFDKKYEKTPKEKLPILQNFNHSELERIKEIIKKDNSGQFTALIDSSNDDDSKKMEFSSKEISILESILTRYKESAKDKLKTRSMTSDTYFKINEELKELMRKISEAAKDPDYPSLIILDNFRTLEDWVNRIQSWRDLTMVFYHASYAFAKKISDEITKQNKWPSLFRSDAFGFAITLWQLRNKNYEAIRAEIIESQNWDALFKEGASKKIEGTQDTIKRLAEDSTDNQNFGLFCTAVTEAKKWSVVFKNANQLLETLLDLSSHMETHKYVKNILDGVTKSGEWSSIIKDQADFNRLCRIVLNPEDQKIICDQINLLKPNPIFLPGVREKKEAEEEALSLLELQKNIQDLEEIASGYREILLRPIKTESFIDINFPLTLSEIQQRTAELEEKLKCFKFDTETDDKTQNKLKKLKLDIETVYFLLENLCETETTTTQSLLNLSNTFILLHGIFSKDEMTEKAEKIQSRITEHFNSKSREIFQGAQEYSQKIDLFTTLLGELEKFILLREEQRNTIKTGISEKTNPIMISHAENILKKEIIEQPAEDLLGKTIEELDALNKSCEKFKPILGAENETYIEAREIIATAKLVIENINVVGLRKALSELTSKTAEYHDYSEKRKKLIESEIKILTKKIKDECNSWLHGIILEKPAHLALSDLMDAEKGLRFEPLDFEKEIIKSKKIALGNGIAQMRNQLQTAKAKFETDIAGALTHPQNPKLELTKIKGDAEKLLQDFEGEINLAKAALGDNDKTVKEALTLLIEKNLSVRDFITKTQGEVDALTTSINAELTEIRDALQKISGKLNSSPTENGRSTQPESPSKTLSQYFAELKSIEAKIGSFPIALPTLKKEITTVLDNVGRMIAQAEKDLLDKIVNQVNPKLSLDKLKELKPILKTLKSVLGAEYGVVKQAKEKLKKVMDEIQSHKEKIDAIFGILHQPIKPQQTEFEQFHAIFEALKPYLPFSKWRGSKELNSDILSNLQKETNTISSEISALLKGFYNQTTLLLQDYEELSAEYQRNTNNLSSSELKITEEKISALRKELEFIQKTHGIIGGCYGNEIPFHSDKIDAFEEKSLAEKKYDKVTNKIATALSDLTTLQKSIERRSGEFLDVKPADSHEPTIKSDAIPTNPWEFVDGYVVGGLLTSLMPVKNSDTGPLSKKYTHIEIKNPQPTMMSMHPQQGSVLSLYAGLTRIRIEESYVFKNLGNGEMDKIKAKIQNWINNPSNEEKIKRTPDLSNKISQINSDDHNSFTSLKFNASEIETISSILSGDEKGKLDIQFAFYPSKGQDEASELASHLVSFEDKLQHWKTEFEDDQTNATELTLHFGLSLPGHATHLQVKLVKNNPKEKVAKVEITNFDSLKNNNDQNKNSPSQNPKYKLIEDAVKSIFSENIDTSVNTPGLVYGSTTKNENRSVEIKFEHRLTTPSQTAHTCFDILTYRILEEFNEEELKRKFARFKEWIKNKETKIEGIDLTRLQKLDQLTTHDQLLNESYAQLLRLFTYYLEYSQQKITIEEKIQWFKKFDEKATKKCFEEILKDPKFSGFTLSDPKVSGNTCTVTLEDKREPLSGNRNSDRKITITAQHNPEKKTITRTVNSSYPLDEASCFKLIAAQSFADHQSSAKDDYKKRVELEKIDGAGRIVEIGNEFYGYLREKMLIDAFFDAGFEEVVYNGKTLSRLNHKVIASEINSAPAQLSGVFRCQKTDEPGIKDSHNSPISPK